jgi:hypothetical protein
MKGTNLTNLEKTLEMVILTRFIATSSPPATFGTTMRLFTFTVTSPNPPASPTLRLTPFRNGMPHTYSLYERL